MPTDVRERQRDDRERMHLLALNMKREVGPARAAAKLFRMYGRHGQRSLFANATCIDPTAPPKWPRMPPDVPQNEPTQEDLAMAGAEMERMREADVGLTTWLDPEYPVNLRHILYPPPVLYRRGDLKDEDWLAVAVVGSRRASADYVDFAFHLGATLAEAGITVVSGLAQGIDGAAHEGALSAGGRTLAVLATGADIVYPKNHGPLAEEVAQNGALLTYYPMGTPPRPHHFPARNWVIAGLALVTVVVQCGPKSGALITAHYAAAQGRDVMAVPGHVGSDLSRGANELLRDGAGVVIRPQDVVDALKREIDHLGRSVEVPAFGAPPPHVPERLEQIHPQSDLHRRVLEELAQQTLSVDELAQRLNERADVVQGTLVRLELRGDVIALGGGRFVRSSRTLD